MKFIHHLGGDIADIDGNTFIFKNPVDITNRSTLQKLLKHPEFQVVDNGTSKKEVTVPKGKPCGKCGKFFERGLYLHEKYCR